MIPLTACAGRTLAVFGLGASGLAVCRALAAGGAGVIAWDDAPAKAARHRVDDETGFARCREIDPTAGLSKTCSSRGRSPRAAAH